MEFKIKFLNFKMFMHCCCTTQSYPKIRRKLYMKSVLSILSYYCLINRWYGSRRTHWALHLFSFRLSSDVDGCGNLHSIDICPFEIQIFNFKPLVQWTLYWHQQQRWRHWCYWMHEKALFFKDHLRMWRLRLIPN